MIVESERLSAGALGVLKRAEAMLEFAVDSGESARIVSPDPATGFPEAKRLELTREYFALVADIWVARPALFASCFSILFGDEKALKVALSRLLEPASDESIRNSNLSLKPIDALLFYSSNKPNWYPATKDLAYSISSGGYTVGLMSPESLIILEPGKAPAANEQVEGFRQYLARPLTSELRELFLVAAEADADYLTSRVNNLGSAEIRQCFCDKSVLQSAIYQSYERQYKIDSILRQLRPAFILTNGQHLPYATELLLRGRLEGIATALFYHETTTLPVSLVVAENLWVWNEVVRDEFMTKSLASQSVRLEAVGTAELDYIGSQEQPTPYEQAIMNATQDKNVFVFAANAFPNGANSLGEEQALGWMEELVAGSPDWVFFYKFRHFHHGRAFPGIERLQKFPNCIFPSEEIPLASLLKWPNVKVVASTGSTATFVAAGAGKMAVRLFPAQEEDPRPVIDQVSIAIRSSQQLSQMLTDFDSLCRKYQQTLEARFDRCFPYQGGVLGRLEALVIEQLKRQKRGSTKQITSTTESSRATGSVKHLKHAVDSFDEEKYRIAHPDAERLVRDGRYLSLLHHYLSTKEKIS